MDWKAIEAATNELGATCEYDHPGGEVVFLALLKFMRDNGHEYTHPRYPPLTDCTQEPKT